VRGRGGTRSKWKLGILAAIALSVFVSSRYQDSLKGQPATPAPTNNVFSPAHSSLPQAISHFFGHRPEGRQPIAFVHKVHVNEVQMECVDCHFTVARGPIASIPDIRTCWSCHATTLTEHPEIRKMKDYYDKGQDIPWQRVWGWVEESHVRFNHAPHIREGIDCKNCHGDVSEMTVATRVVDHTMEFCVSCHRERNAPDDCVTCHY